VTKIPTIRSSISSMKYSASPAITGYPISRPISPTSSPDFYRIATSGESSDMARWLSISKACSTKGRS
jgi:hypothetical protein